MLRFRRATVAVLILMSFWPTLVFGQAPSKAGVVTTLEGRASATRVVLPNPVALHFKDDVFLNDEITTAEKSLARILLGGKAVVTVRERSSLTITEVPGLSTIDIASGKIAMAVARERLRPGEQIQIRTPNAITGIRGTALIVEVVRSIPDTKQPDPNAITRLGVFEGSVDVRHINPITKAPLAPAVNVAVNTKFSAAGTQPAAVAPFAPGDAAAFQAGVTPAGPQHVQAANETALAAQAQETANALLTALGTGAVVAPPLTPTPVSPVDTRPELNDDSERLMPVVEQQPPPPPPPPASTTPSNIVIDPELQAFMSSPVGTAVVAIPAGSGEVSTDGTAFTVQPATPVPADLNVPLLTVTDGDLTVNGQLLDVLGAFSSTTAAPLVSLDPTVTMITGDFVRVGPTSDALVAGPLLRDAGGTLTVGGNLLNVAGGSLTSTGTDALIQLDGTTLNIGGALLRTGGGSSDRRANVTVNGSLVRAVDSTLRLSGLLTGPGTGGLPGIFEPNFGSVLTDPSIGRRDDAAGQIALGFAFPFRGQTFSNVEISTNGFVSLGGVNGAACCNGSVDAFLRGAPRIAVAWYDLHPSGTDQSGQFIGGGLKFATFPGRAVFTWDAVPEFPNRGSNTVQMQLLSDGRIVFGYGPLASEIHTVVVGITQGRGAADPGETDFSFAGSFTTGSQPTVYEFFAEGTIDLAGSNVVFTPNALGGWDVTSTALGFGGVALALLDGSSVNQTGGGPLVNLFRTGLSASQLVQVSGGSRLDVSGTLLHSQLGALSFSGDLAQVTGSGSRVTSTSPDPLISVSGGSLSVAGRLLAAESGATVSTAGPLAHFSGLRDVDDSPGLRIDGTPIHLVRSSLTTGGPLLDLVHSDLAIPERPLVQLENGSTLTVTSGPFIRLIGGSLTADSLVTGVGAGNRIDVTGTVLDLSNNAVVTLNRLARGDETPTLRLSSGQPLIRTNRSVLTTTETQALFDLGDDDGVLTTTGVALVASDVPPPLELGPGQHCACVTADVPRAAVAAADGPSRLHLNAALMDLGGVILSDPSPQVHLTGTFVGQQGTNALIESAGLPVTARGPLLVTSASTLNVATNLLSFGNGTFIAEHPVSSGALLQFRDSTVVAQNSLILVRSGAAVNLARGLLEARAGALPTSLESRNTSLLGIINGASVTSTATDAPLLRFRGDLHPMTVTTASNLIALAVTEEATPPSLSLRGSLLEAINATIRNGDPTQNAFTFLFVGDGSTVRTSQTEAPLLVFGGTTVDSAGNILTLRRSALGGEIPSRIVLSGPLVLANNSRFNTTSLGLSDSESACCAGFFIGEGAELTSTSPLPLITLANGSNFNAGPDGQSGGSFFTVTDSSGGFGGQPASSTLTLAGSWLRAAASTITAQFSLLDVTRSTVSSSSAEPLVELDSATVNVAGSVTRVVDGRLLASTVAALANVMNSSVTTGSHAVDVAGVNGVVELRDLVRLSNSIMTVNNGHLANVNGGRLTVTGNLVSLANRSTLNILNGLLLNMFGGTATIGGALVTFSGSGNTINVTNNLVPNFIHPSGIPIFVGANTPNPIITGTPLAGLSGNTININGQPLSANPSGSLIAVQNGATLRIGATP
jgi:hypothetical protein